MLTLTIGQYFMKAEGYNFLNLLDINYIIGICTMYIFSLQADYRIFLQRDIYMYHDHL